jgi:hypothetical protein
MPTTSPAANLSFLPWVRQGAAAAISTVDTLGPAQSAVADLTAALAINSAPALPISVRLRGPADVVGIDANQIVRMDPRPGSDDFEPNYFPCIEFDRPDFPWLFTPARAEANARLRPWLCLIIVRKQDGVTLGSTPDTPLATLLIATPANPAAELPDLRESWAWVHAQAAAPDNGAASVGAALGGAPKLSLSRLLCPRLLAPSTDYIACVVPTFELGRKSALGLPVTDGDLIGANALAPAWSLATTPAQVLLPLLHHWEFRAGVGGDFESLARKLKPQPVPAGLGQRPLDISTPGFALPVAAAPGVTLGLEGALEPIDRDDNVPPPWPSGTQAPFQSALAAIVNTPGQSAVVAPQADPILAPPLYGPLVCGARDRGARRRRVAGPTQPRSAHACVRRVRHGRRAGTSGGADVRGVGTGCATAAGEPARAPVAAQPRGRHAAARAPLCAAGARQRAGADGAGVRADPLGRWQRDCVAHGGRAESEHRADAAGSQSHDAQPCPSQTAADAADAALGFTRAASASWVGAEHGQGEFLATPAFDLATVSAIQRQSRPERLDRDPRLRAGE